MSGTHPRALLVDVSEESRDVLVRRLTAQGYTVETAADPAAGADMALASPPSVIVADLWMPSISGVQLCRLLRAEPATADVPVILRGPTDDPRSRFWAERAGAAAYVVKGRMGELVRALGKAVAAAPKSDAFFMQLSGGSVDVQDRIARHLDAALFESVIAGEVRALAGSGSFEQLFDSLSQLLSQLISYRWVAVRTRTPQEFAIHHHPRCAADAEKEARAALGMDDQPARVRVVDEDARDDASGPEPIVATIRLGALEIGALALAPTPACEGETAQLVSLVARELGGAMRITTLLDESQRLATIDPLTGLMNRRALLVALNAEVERSRRYGLPLSFLLLDVDHFKAINDTHGHATGDRVLSRLGAHLRSLLRTPDSCARWGGEEFVAVLTSTALEGAKLVGERVRASIVDTAIETPNGPMHATVSVGVAGLEASESAESLIDRADRAMYAAKLAGRNRLCIAQENVTGASERVLTARSA